jgi:parvulin-like peptidyl-prolyl isomerase
MSFFKEPLVQFVVLGLALYVFINILAPDNLVQNDTNTIQVNDDRLVEYLQFQRKSFEPAKALQMLNKMPAGERDRLIDNYVRDEALYREALSYGLDDNDEIIRRRLIQKMEYIAQGFYDNVPALEEADLRAHFDKNIDQYKIDPSITFTHVFFPAENDDQQVVLRQAEQELSQLNRKKVDFSEAGKYGKRFLYNLNYVERTPAFVSSHFGQAFSQNIFTLKDLAQWQGPIRSEYGYHLVNIKSTSPARTPDLEEVAAKVLADTQREQHRDLKSAAIDKIVERYQRVSQQEKHISAPGSE